MTTKTAPWKAILRHLFITPLLQNNKDNKMTSETKKKKVHMRCGQNIFVESER